MSSRCTLTSLLVVHQARSASLLPFLYHTRTLLAEPLPARFNTPKCRHCVNHRSISSAPRRQIGAYSSRRSDPIHFEDLGLARPRSTPSSDSSIPFEDVDSQFEAQRPKKSTITASEKAIFDRIFKDIDQAASRKEGEEGLEDDQDMNTDPYEDLNSIFDTAIQNMRTQEDQQAKSGTIGTERSRRYERAMGQLDLVVAGSTTFKRPLRLANGVVLGAEMASEEHEMHSRKACDDHKTLVFGMLGAATTDVQIWSILEGEIFSLIKQLDAQLKFQEKALKAQEREEKKVAKERNAGQERTASNAIITRRGKAPKNIPDEARAPRELPTNTLFSILQSNYADYLLSALRLLRRHHPTSSYPFYLLPTMKRLGSISYVLGVNTNFYNEILLLKWTQSSDLHGMADLLQEMINQGIEMNEVTFVLIRRLSHKRRYAFHGRFGPIAQKWWDMGGNMDGWRRVWSIYEGVRREESHRRERNALLERKEYERLGEGEEN